jgi:hypothetical protein
VLIKLLCSFIRQIIGIKFNIYFYFYNDTKFARDERRDFSKNTKRKGKLMTLGPFEAYLVRRESISRQYDKNSPDMAPRSGK